VAARARRRVRLIIGNQVADLLEGWPDAPWSPGFRQGAAVQAVCDAMEASAAQGRWVAVSEVTGAKEEV
jgi:hypothetical protein